MVCQTAIRPAVAAAATSTAVAAAAAAAAIISRPARISTGHRRRRHPRDIIRRAAVASELVELLTLKYVLYLFFFLYIYLSGTNPLRPAAVATRTRIAATWAAAHRTKAPVATRIVIATRTASTAAVRRAAIATRNVRSARTRSAAAAAATRIKTNLRARPVTAVPFRRRRHATRTRIGTSHPRHPLLNINIPAVRRRAANTEVHPRRIVIHHRPANRPEIRTRSNISQSSGRMG